MKLRLLALTVIAALVGVLIYNVIGDQKASDQQRALQEEYEIQPADNLVAQEIPESDGEAPVEGEKMAEFQANTLDGSVVSLSQYQGKKLIINFWATWCGPCIEEMPEMQAYYENEAQDQNVEILAVNLTSMDNGIPRVESFVEDFGLTFPILLDEQGSLGSQFRAVAVPTTYLVDEEGRIQKRLMGPMDRDMMISYMDEM